MNRFLHRHRGQTGIFVYGWFPRPRTWGPAGWRVVGVSVDGFNASEDILSQYSPRHYWAPLELGRHHVSLFNLNRRQGRSYDLDIGVGEIWLISFKTPNWTFGRMKLEPIWCDPQRIEPTA
jgi:hypothetical protein